MKTIISIAFAVLCCSLTFTNAATLPSNSLSPIDNDNQNNHHSIENSIAVKVHHDATQSGAAFEKQLATVDFDQASSFLQVGEDFGYCKTCVFVLERIKKGTNMLLPAICAEIFIHFSQAYPICHQVLDSLSLNGNNVKYWLFEGCYKYELYQAKEWVKPCPSHVMCTVLKDLQNRPFCKPLPMEDPFTGEEPAAGASSGTSSGTTQGGTKTTSTKPTGTTSPTQTKSPTTTGTGKKI